MDHPDPVPAQEPLRLGSVPSVVVPEQDSASESDDMPPPASAAPSGSAGSRALSPPRRQRACMPCTRAKARCHFREENIERHACDRCLRLKIQCTAKTTKGLRKPRQIKPLLSRVASLEQKLETMTSLLAAAQAGDNSQASTPENVSETCPQSHHQVTAFAHHSLSIRTPDSTTSAGAPSPSMAPTIYLPNHPPASSSASSMSAGPVGPAGPAGPAGAYISMPTPPQPQCRAPEAPSLPFGITWDEAQVVLNNYREFYMPRFPFIMVDTGVTPQAFLNERPFLFRSMLVAAAPYSLGRIKKMVRNVRAYLCQRMIVNTERTLDLLQGLLISIAWSRVSPFGDTEMTTLTYLALGYAHNLGITKIPLSILKQLGRDNVPDDLRRIMLQTNNSDAHSLEEQRTLLGCYYILSSNSMQYGRTNPLKTLYVELCANNLAWTAFAPTDFLAEKMIRLSQITEKISTTFGGVYDNERARPDAFLVENNVKMLRAEIDQIADSVSPDHPLYAQFRIQSYHVLVRLHEPATAFRDPTIQASSPEARYRNRYLFECLHACRLLLETTVALPPSDFQYHPISSAAGIQVTIVIATRLLLLEAPGWDLGAARASLDLVGLVDALVKILDQANEEYLARVRDWNLRLRLVDDDEQQQQQQQTDQTFGTLPAYAARAKRARDWYVSRLEGAQAPGGGGGGSRDIAMDLDLMTLYSQSMGNPTWYAGWLNHAGWSFDNQM